MLCHYVTIHITILHFTWSNAKCSKEGGWRNELVRGEALCKGKQVFCVTESATVTGTWFLKILDNTKLNTHTHTQEDSSVQVISSSHRPLPTQRKTNTTDKNPCHQRKSNLPLQKSISCNLHLRPGVSNWGSPEGHMGHICVVMRAADNQSDPRGTGTLNF